MEPSPFLPGLSPGRELLLYLLPAIAAGIVVRALLLRRQAERLRRWGAVFERAILSLVLFAMVGLSIFQIVLRNVFDTGFIWIDPLLRALVLWLAFLGSITAAARGRHIAIDIASRLLPKRARGLLARFVCLVAGAICIALAEAAYAYLGLEREFRATAFLGLPTWAVQSVLFFGFGLLAFRFLADAFLGPPDPDADAPEEAA
jgi:TRAP-type C4-dicarboxylate transport system permease small subunit